MSASSGNHSKSAKNYDVQVKLLTIGDSNVGKSCLIGRYVDDSFSSTMMSTIGVDFRVKMVDMGGVKVKVQVWDTAGQERYRAITASYFRDATGIMLVFDLTKPESFKSIHMWLQQISYHCPENMPRVLVGNKCDLLEDRAVTQEQAQALASQHGMKYMESSAKTGERVEEVFALLAKSCAEQKIGGSPEQQRAARAGSLLAGTSQESDKRSSRTYSTTSSNSSSSTGRISLRFGANDSPKKSQCCSGGSSGTSPTVRSPSGSQIMEAD